MIRAKVDGNLVAVRADWGLLRQVTGDSLDLVTAEDSALLLEDHLAPWFDAVEQASGLSIELDAVCDIGKLAAIRPIGLKLTTGEHQAVLEFWANADAVSAIQATAVPATQDHDPIAISLSCMIFETSMLTRDLANLKVGSGVFLGPQTEAAVLQVETQFSAPVMRSDTTLTLQSDFSPIPTTGGRPMAGATDPGSPKTYDDLEVRIQIRAGEALITLADLRKLSTGSILTLPGYDGGYVDLLVNDQRIGRGILVEVPGGRAVEITELFANG